jgi:thioredoxin-dependent peroxiredoxin
MLSWLWSDPLPVGTKAPVFTLQDESGHAISLAGLRGKNVVLVFYPGDETPVCTRQLCEFRDRWDQARARNVAVFGVNPGGAARHARFREKRGLPFPLLVDEGRRVASLYRAGGLLIRRTVYLIGPDGIIRYARRGKPDPDEVLAAAV